MMSTRRQMIRGVATASMAAILNPHSVWSATRKRAAGSWPTGVRIVFGGAWIFCAHFDGKPGYMCAVSLDMAKKPHHFPYGFWSETSLGQWANDTATRELPSGSTRATVNVQKSGSPWQPAFGVSTLFQQTHSNGPFVEIGPNGSGPYSIQNQSDPHLRVVELPIPSRVLPTTIRTDATLNCSTHCKPDQFPGLAFTYIFVYDGADTMTFSPLPGVTVTGSTLPSSDLLIHTVPKGMYGPNHAAEMFEAMLMVVDSNLAKYVTLSVPQMQKAPAPGPKIPLGISAEEQGNIMDSPHQNAKGDFATCGAIGVGLGG